MLLRAGEILPGANQFRHSVRNTSWSEKTYSDYRRTVMRDLHTLSKHFSWQSLFGHGCFAKGAGDNWACVKSLRANTWSRTFLEPWRQMPSTLNCFRLLPTQPFRFKSCVICASRVSSWSKTLCQMVRMLSTPFSSCNKHQSTILPGASSNNISLHAKAARS